MNLGDAFSRRKQIQAEIQQWIGRLQLAGKDTLIYRVKHLEGDKHENILPGTKKEYKRMYTIEEAQGKIKTLLDEDRNLARRISLTNQIARTKIVDLDGIEKEVTIPELLILRNEIVPKLEETARATPIQSTGVDVIERDENHIKWIDIQPNIKRMEEISDKGLKLTKEKIENYQVSEYIDYGKPQREIYDEIDEIHDFMTRIKNAINAANKTELVN